MTNKKSKKFFAIAASTTLVASAIVPVVSANPTSFPDVGTDNIFKNDIETLAQQKIINGFPDGTFKPKVILKRRDVVTMLAKYIHVFQGEEYPSDFKSNIRFTDLRPLAGKDDDLLMFAALAYEKGIFEGYNGQLSYNNEITREEAGTSVLRLIAYALGFNDENHLITFLKSQSDYNSIVRDHDKASVWARDNIDALSYLKITLETNFNPKAKIPREQFAAFMNRAMNNTLNNPAFVTKATEYLEGGGGTVEPPPLGSIIVSPNDGVLGISGAKPGSIYRIYNGIGQQIGYGVVDAAGNLRLILESTVNPGEKIKIVVSVDGVDHTHEFTIPGTPTEIVSLKGELSALISEVEYVKTSSNGLDIPTTEKWTIIDAKTAIDNAVLSARNTWSKNNVTASELEVAIGTLENAIRLYNAAKQNGQKQVVNVDFQNMLELLVKTAEKLNNANFTEGSWMSFSSALSSARSVLAKQNPSDSELKAETSALLAAINQLVSKNGTDTDVNAVLREAITNLIDSLKNLTEADYTTVTWQVLVSAMQNATSVASNANSTKEQLTGALTNLAAAIDGLVRKDDQNRNGLSDALEEELRKLLDDISKLTQADYTEMSWSNLQSKVATADGNYADDNALKAVIDSIRKAKDDLVFKGDKAQLNNLLKDIDTLKVAVSTDGSDIAPKNQWTTQAALTTFNLAIDAAKVVLNDANAEEVALTLAVTNLNNAITAYKNAMQYGTATLTVKALDHKGSLIASTSSNMGIGGFTNVATSTDFTTVGLGLLDIVSLDAIANNSNVNSSKFTVPDNHRFSMDFNFTSSAVLGLSRKNLAIYKIEGNQLKRVWQDGYGSFSLLGIPIQSKYNFSVSNLMPGEYIFAIVRNDGLGAEVVSGNTINIMDRELVNMTADINSQQPIVTSGVSGNMILNNSFSANDVKVSKVNSRMFTSESTDQTIQGNYGKLTINPSTGAYSYKANGTPLAISKVETFEYTLVDNDGREGKSYLHIRFNQEGEQEFNWSTTDLSADINFGTASSERVSTTLSYTSDGVNDYDDLGRPLSQRRYNLSENVTSNVSSQSIITDFVTIPDNESILSFEAFATLGPDVKIEIYDNLSRIVNISGKTTNVVRPGLIGTSNVEIRDLKPGLYKVKLIVETQLSYYGIRNVEVRTNRYTGTAVSGNVKSNDSISNGLPLVFADTMIDGTKTLEGQFGSITINPDGAFTYNTNYSRSVNLGSLFNRNVDYYPITGNIGQTEVFNYYYEKPNGEQIPAKLEIYLDGTVREIQFKSNTVNFTATNAVGTANPSKLQYSVVASGHYASTVDFE